jgi:acetylornithine/succinyldiaminopimelate/putrescine aminotransferase
MRECPAITARRARRAALLGAADTDPVVWSEAEGCNIWDVDGNRFVDLEAGFGVASLGHRHPQVVAAGQAQLGRLPHAMGDAFPDIRRIELMEKLCSLTGMDRVLFGSSGSDAVEAAIKTCLLATDRSRILAFYGGYHGLASGPLAAIGYKRADFQAPFSAMLGAHVDFVPYGGELPALNSYAGVLVEPIQGRGGMRVPPEGWLKNLHQQAKQAGALVIHDEIYSGFGRTGRWFAGDYDGVKPDLLCVGKALANGFPISACLGTARAMDSWGASRGEAIHTQTFLGNPVGCAMALAAISVMEREQVAERAAETGAWFKRELEQRLKLEVRGRGLMLGVVTGGLQKSLKIMQRMLLKGWIVLPCGEQGEAVGLSPALLISREVLGEAVEALGKVLES